MAEPLTDEQIDAASPEDLRAAYRELRGDVRTLQRRITKIVAALADLRAQGKYTGGFTPYGFDLDKDGETLVEVDLEQRAIARARAIKAAQPGTSLRAIARLLEEEGLVSRNDKPFAPTQINRMLRHG